MNRVKEREEALQERKKEGKHLRVGEEEKNKKKEAKKKTRTKTGGKSDLTQLKNNNNK